MHRVVAVDILPGRTHYDVHESAVVAELVQELLAQA
jgi:hypothetical protein